MKSLKIAISIILFSAFHARADYSPIRLFQMALEADTVIDAKITRLDGMYFWVSSHTQNAKSNHLKVVKFKDWPCARRWEPYTIGQRVILFLKREKDAYIILSAGGEGELPVVGDSLMINAECLPFKTTWKVSEWGVRVDSLNTLRRRFGKSNYLYKAVYKLDVFLEAVLRFRLVYKWNKIERFLTSEDNKQSEGADSLFAVLRKDMEVTMTKYKSD